MAVVLPALWYLAFGIVLGSGDCPTESQNACRMSGLERKDKAGRSVERSRLDRIRGSQPHVDDRR